MTVNKLFKETKTVTQITYDIETDSFLYFPNADKYPNIFGIIRKEVR